MRKVLRKVKSQWAVLGIMGATVIALGAVDVPHVSAAEVDGQVVTENLNDYLYSIDGEVITITGYQGTDGNFVIPSSIDGLPVTRIGDGAFFGCSGLTSVTIPESVTHIGSQIFYDCSGLENIEVSEDNPVYSSDADGVLYDKSQTSLLCYPIGKIEASFIIPEGVTDFGYAAFGGCSSLTSVTIPSSVTNLGFGTFSGCSGLTSVTIPEGVTNIGNFVFEGCSGLTSVTIPEGVINIGSQAFYGCSSLENIEVSEGNPVYFSDADGVLYDKSQTSLLYYPIGKTETSFIIPEGVTDIGYAAFGGCSGLTSVTIPKGVTSIASGAFSGCSGLISMTIPEGVTTIQRNAFSYCTGLTSIDIPSTVISIYPAAFVGCSSLDTINACPMTAPVTIVSHSAHEEEPWFLGIPRTATLYTQAGATGYDATPWTWFNKAEFNGTEETYAQIVSETAVDYAATVSRSGDGINTQPWNVKGWQTVGTSATYVDQTVEVSKEATTDYGVTWALISQNGQELGWVAKDALTAKIETTYAQIVSETVVDYAATVSRNGDGINTQPWNVKGWQTVGTSAIYYDQTVEVSKEATTDYGVTWALISQNGQELGWVAKDALTAKTEAIYAQIVSEAAVNYEATISRSGDGINTQPWNVKGWQTVGTSATYFNQPVEVSREVTTDYGVTWALVSLNGQELGWIAKDALSVQTYAQITKETVVDYPAAISRGTDAINTAPWGARGYQTIGTSATYVGKTVDVTKEQVTDYGVTWALVSLDGKELGWIAKDALKVQTYAQITNEAAVDYPATISRGTDAINTAPWGAKGYQTIGSSAVYVGKTVDVAKEQVTDYGVTWAQISLNGEVLGWIAKDALAIQNYAKIVSETNVDYPATINRGTDAINTAPWGTRGYQTIGSSADYVGKSVEILKEQVTDYGVTWALVYIGDTELGWITKDALTQSNYVQILSTNEVAYDAIVTRGTDGINDQPWGTKGFETIGTSADYLNSIVTVTQEKVADNGVTWALINKDGRAIGWVDRAALTVSVNDTSQANLISLGEVQALVSGITPYFEVYVWDDQSHITITGDYMYIYNNYDSNLWRYTYDAWIDQVFNAINAKGWDGEATVNASYFMINLPLNQ